MWLNFNVIKTDSRGYLRHFESLSNRIWSDVTHDKINCLTKETISSVLLKLWSYEELWQILLHCVTEFLRNLWDKAQLNAYTGAPQRPASTQINRDNNCMIVQFIAIYCMSALVKLMWRNFWSFSFANNPEDYESMDV